MEVEPHLFNYWPFVFCLISAIYYFFEDVTCAFGLIILSVYFFLRVSCVKYLVTKKRVVVKTGIISTHTNELRNLKVESIAVEQSILGNVLGYATLTFNGTGGNKLKFKNIADVFEIKSQIEDIIEKTKTATTH